MLNEDQVEDLKDLIAFLSDRVRNITNGVENNEVEEAMGQVAYAEVRLDQIKQALFEASK
jgi:hypothetical protein